MFEKVYRPLVIALLVVIVLVQAAGLILTIQSNNAAYNKQIACQTATTAALKQLSTMQSSYETDVYNNVKVDNIYKQIFTQGEYQFETEQLIASIEAACR
jgi:predicted Zn-dependent protease